MLKRLIDTYRDAFSGLPRRVWLLSAVTLIHRSGTMVLPFLTIYLTAERGMSVRTAGLYLAVYGVGSGLGAVLGGRLAERWGTVRSMQWTLTVAGIAFIALGIARSHWAIGGWLFAASVAAEGFRTPSSADLGTAVPPEVRPRAFALRRLAINLGMAIGPAAGGLIATIDYRWLFIADGATCLLAAVAVMRWLAPRPEQSLDRGDGTRAAAVEDRSAGAAQARASLWRDKVFVGVLACAAMMDLAFIQLFGTYPLTLHQDFAYSEVWIGGFLALNTVLIVLFEMVLVHRVAGLRPLYVVALGNLLLAIGFALVPLGSRLGLAVLAMVVITVGEMLTAPMLEGFVASRVPEAALARAMGLMTATFAITFVVAPIVGTAVYGLWGYRTLWLSAACCASLAALGYLLVGRSLRAPRHVVRPGAD